MSEEHTWTGNSEVDAAIMMLDRIDCSPEYDSRVDAVEATLRRLYARNQELEASLQKLTSDYEGAGGVSAQRVTQAKWTGALRGEDCKYEVFDDRVKTMIPRNPVFVRITHIPTGVTVECRDDERSGHRNSANAWLLLEAKLKEKKKLDFSSDPAEDRIEQPIEMVAAQETSGLLARIEKEISTAQINNHRMAPQFGKMDGEHCVIVSSLLATIEGFLNEVNGQQAAAPVVLPEPAEFRFRVRSNAAGGIWSDWRKCSKEAYENKPILRGWEYETSKMYTEQQVRELLDKAACTKSQTTAQEPFGYFKAEPFGWRDCAETDEGAVALYEAPQPQADALDAAAKGSNP